MEEREQEEGSSSQNVNLTVSSFKERGSFFEIILSDCSSFFIFPEEYPSFAGADFGSNVILSQKQLDILHLNDSICRGYSKALSSLSFTPTTTFMMKQKLIRKGFKSDIATRVTEILLKKGLLNDRKFAENWVLSRLALKPAGISVLKANLRKKGISREITENVLKTLNPDGERRNEYIEGFHQALAKEIRRRGTDFLQNKEKNDKIQATLLRKGYPFSLINYHMKEQGKEEF